MLSTNDTTSICSIEFSFSCERILVAEAHYKPSVSDELNQTSFELIEALKELSGKIYRECIFSSQLDIQMQTKLTP